MNRNKHKNTIIFLIILFAILFISRTKILSSLQFNFVNVSSKPIRWISAIILEAKKILYYHRTFDEYKKLKAEVNILKTRLMSQEEVIYENTRLQRLLDFKQKLVYSSIVASVIGRDPSYWNSSIVIDKGEEDGIAAGMSVVNDLGVVGKIITVGKKQSKVILLTDPQFSVAALVKRPRENGLISGTLQGKCQLTYVDDASDIRVGDAVITSKLSSSFPESLFIGHVESVEQSEEGIVNQYIVKPSVSFSSLEEVLVIQKED